MASREYEEIVRISPVGFPLKNIPVVKIISVYGKTSQSGIFEYGKFFGSTDWIELDTNDIVVHTKDDLISLSLPPSLFGTPYEEAKIKYVAGIAETPHDVEEVILEIARLLNAGEIDEWRCFLPVEILDVIEKYRKGAN
jgi:hypothetical protein